MLIEENPASGGLELSYSDGLLEIGAQTFSETVLLRGTHAEKWAAGKTFETWRPDDFFQTASGSGDTPEIVILGTGSAQKFVHPRIMAELARHSIGLECMTTSAACRTVLLLQGEGRKVWAWLWV